MGLKERRKREKQERREQILTAAKALIFRDGFSDASVSRIAKQAELGVGTLYFYFKSKLEIIAAIQDEGLELLAEQIEDAYHKGADPSDSIKKIAMAYLAFSEEKKEYFNIINHVIASRGIFFPQGLKIRADDKGYEILSFLIRAVVDGLKSGMFRTIEPRKHAIMLWAMLHGLIQFEKLKDTLLHEEDHQSMYVHAVDHFLDSICA